MNFNDSNCFKVYGIANNQLINDISKTITTHNSNFWTEKLIILDAKIPNDKPEIGNIEDISLSVDILDKKVIKPFVSDVAINIEGKRITEKKLVIKGQLSLTVRYTSTMLTQQEHNFTYVEPFFTQIVLDNTVKDCNDFDITSCIESFIIMNIYSRNIECCINIFLKAEKNGTRENYQQIKDNSCYDIYNHSESDFNEKSAFLLKQDRMWAEFNIEEKCIISNDKPKIGKIINVTSDVTILNKRINSNSVIPLTSNEGTSFADKKLLIELLLKQNIVYSVFNEDGVYSIDFEEPYFVYIALDKDVNTTDDLMVDYCIEYVQMDILDERTILKNTNIIIKANKPANG